jgi:hypothetical protein
MRLLIATLLLVHGAAMGQTFACQYTGSAGFHWENGGWSTTGFHVLPPFFLKMNGSNLEQKSVADFFGAMGETASYIRCEKHPHRAFHSCMNQYGAFLHFNESTRMGGRAVLGGSDSTSKRYRDSTSVSHFTCQQM